MYTSFLYFYLIYAILWRYSINETIYNEWTTITFRYMFDEPSSYLDVKQRLKAAKVIRDLLRADE